MNEVATTDERQQLAVKIDAALFRGDLSKLSDEERVVHVHNVCRSLGLNPSTSPLSYITLNGKLVLYAKKDATDQLRKLHGITIEIANRVVNDGLLTVHARAIDKTGRRDEDFGVVSIAGLKGEAAANAMLKCVTKAKRRVTLSIAGLGFLDETEVEDISGAFDHLASKPAIVRVPDVPEPNNDAIRRALLNQQADLDAARAAERDAPPVEEAEPHEVERDDDGERAWSSWATQLIAFVRAASTVQRIDEWIVANSDQFEALKHYDTGKYNRLRHMIQAVQDAKATKARD